MKQKKKSLLYLVLSVLAATFMFSEPASARTKRIGVLAFENVSQVSDRAFGRGMADILASELIRNRNYEMVERAQIDRLINEMGFCMEGFCDQSEAPKIGRIANLDYVVTGSIIEAGAWENRPLLAGSVSQTTIRVLVNVKVMEVETGRLVLSENAEVENNTSTIWETAKVSLSSPALYSATAREAIAKAAHTIMDVIEPQEAVVVLFKEREREVTINFGREDGVRVGHKLKVVREGEPLIDPFSGEQIGVDIIEIADITITRTEMNHSVGRINKRYQYEIIDDRGRRRRVDWPILPGDLARPADRFRERVRVWGVF